MTKGGNEYVLDLDPSASIRDAKQFFQIIYSLNSEKITIIYHNRILSDSETLSNFIDATLPGLFIVSDEINDLDEEIRFDKKDLSPILDIKLDSKPKIAQSTKNHVFHRFTNSEALQHNLCNFNSPKLSQISKFYPDNFTSFKVLVINSKKSNSYENINNIRTNVATTNFSKTIGEALKIFALMNSNCESNSLNNYFIMRSKTIINQNSRLYEYNLHPSSILFFNCESSLSKRINLIVSFDDPANPKNIRKVSYNVHKDMSVLDLKKIVSHDFFESKQPYEVSLYYSQVNVMVDDRKIVDYNFVDNSIIRIKKSGLDQSTVMVVVERPTNSMSIKFVSSITVREMKQFIAKQIRIDAKQQIILYNHQMIIKEYQQKLNKLSRNKVFAVQLRTKCDAVYGIEFENGVIKYFDVDDDQNVLSLKILIRDIMNIPISHICLVYNNKILEDEATMGELSISYFSIISCKKQGFYENIPVIIKNTFLSIQKYVSPHTYVSDISDNIKKNNYCLAGEKVNISIPILLFDQNTKMTQVEHCHDTKFVLIEKRPNSFFVTIKTGFNDIFYLPVFPEMTVRNLISLIQLLLNINSNICMGSIKLMCYGIILREVYTLAQYRIMPDYVIYAYLYPY